MRTLIGLALLCLCGYASAQEPAKPKQTYFKDKKDGVKECFVLYGEDGPNLVKFVDKNRMAGMNLADLKAEYQRRLRRDGHWVPFCACESPEVNRD